MRILHHGTIGNKTFTVEEELPDTWTQRVGETADLDVCINYILTAHDVPPNLNYTTRLVINGGYSIEILVDGVWQPTGYTSSDFVEALNYAITTYGGSIYVPNTGFEHVSSLTIQMKSNVTVILESGVQIRKTGGGPNVSFSSVVNAHLVCMNGEAVLIGSGADGNTGIMIMNSTESSVRGFEIRGTGHFIMKLIKSAFNWFENINGHRYRLTGGSSSHGLEVDTSPSNKFLNVRIDAEHTPGSRSAVYVGTNYDGHGCFNIFRGGEYGNSSADNGIYLCSAGSETYRDANVDYTVVKDVRIFGCKASGHSGLKFRPCSHVIAVGIVSEGNHHGMEMGTHMGIDYRGHPNSDYNYVQGTFRNNDVLGIAWYFDADEKTMINNEFDIILEDNRGHGIEITTYNNDNCLAKNNRIHLESRRNKNGTWIQATGTNSFIEENDITGIIENNTYRGLVFNTPNVRYNTFTGVVRNNPTANIVDNGTGNVINLTTLMASFSYTIEDLIVQFADESYVESPNIIVSWLWNFGDGQTSTAQNPPPHTYADYGDYPVTLTITDNLGNQDTASATIHLEAPTPKFTLTIPVPVSGTTDTTYSPGSYEIDQGLTVEVLAIPDAGYKLADWLLDAVNQGVTVNPYPLTMDADYTLEPVFTSVPVGKWSISIGSTPQEGGTTIPSGSIDVDEGQSLLVEATANPPFQFKYWIFDGVIVPESKKQITISAQPPQTIHTLLAVFSTAPTIPGYLIPVSTLSLLAIALYYWLA